jgi:hypothetical protein
MDYRYFLYRIKNIIMDPGKLWEKTSSETSTPKLLRNSIFFPLIILVSVSAIIGSLFFANAEQSAVYSVFVGIKCFILLYITVYLSAYILGEITFPLDLGKDFEISFRIIVFSMTPFLLCELLSRLFESLLFVDIIGLYGLYIFWSGAEKLLNPPQYKKLPLLIATTITIFAIYIITNLILTMLVDRVYFAFFV